MSVLLAACGSDRGTVGTNGGGADNDSTALKVAVMPTIDCLPIYLAYDHGLFREAGVDVTLCSYNAQMDCDTAIERGRVDATVTDLVRAERMQQQGTKLNYVAATPLYWQLVTNQTARIRQLSQLDDRMLAMTRFSATDLLSSLVVDSAQLDPDRVFRIQVNDIGVRLNMLLTGIMDALFLPEPQATLARLSGHHIIYDTRQSDIRLGVLAFRIPNTTDTLRQSQLAGFIKAYNQACDSLNAAPLRHYKDLMVRHTGVPSLLADSLPDSLTFFPHANTPRPADIEKAREWLKLTLTIGH